MATDYRRGIEGFAFGIRDSVTHLEKLALAQSDEVGRLRAGLKEALDGWVEDLLDGETDPAHVDKSIGHVEKQQARIAALRALLE